MVTVICNRIEYALSTDVFFSRKNIVQLKEGKSWVRVLPDTQPIYSLTNEKKDAGKLNTEKLTFSVLSSDSDALKTLSDLNQYLIVRVYVNGGLFIVGDTSYPVIIAYDDNKSVTNYTLSCQRPIV